MSFTPKYYENYKFYLLACLLIGTLIRLYGLNIQSLWLDELYTIVYSSSGIPSLWEHIIIDVHPPLYPVFMFYWFKIFGTSDISARLPSAIAGVLSLLAMYHYSKKVFGQYVSTSATILLSLTYAGVYYSQEARSYSFLILLSIVSTFSFMKIVSNEKTSVRDYIIYTIVCILIAYVHYFGLLLIEFQFIYLFLNAAFHNKQEFLKVVLIQFLLLISYIPWINVMINTLNKNGGGKFWIQKPGLLLIAQFFGLVIYPGVISILIAFVFLMIIPLALDYEKFKSNLLSTLKAMNLKSPLFILFYLAIGTLIAGFIISQSTPILTARNLLTLSPIIYILISVWVSMCSKLSGYKQNAYILTICIVCFALVSPQFYSPNKEQWRESINYAVENSDNQTTFVTLGYTDYYKYYFDQIEIPKNSVIINKGDKDNITNIYTQMIDLHKNKLIILGAHKHKLTENEQNFLESKSKSHEVKEFVLSVVYIYTFD